MRLDESNSGVALSWTIALSLGAAAGFLSVSGLLNGVVAPLLFYGSAMFFLLPHRPHSVLARRLSTWISILFWLWIVVDLGTLLLPFVIGFFLAYLFDPLVSRAERWHVPRWVSALVLNVILVGSVVLVAVYMAPIVGAQLQELVRNISTFVNSAQDFLESRQFYKWLSSFGIPSHQVKSLVQNYLIPKVESASQYIFSIVLSTLSGAAGIVAHIVNIVLVPLLSFYLLTDMPALKKLLHAVLSQRAPRLLGDLIAISSLARAYIAGQLITALFVGVCATIAFVVAGIPYGVMLGVLCGLFNPIPYVGLLASLFVAIVTIILAQSPTPLLDIVLVTVIVNVLHFIASYIIDPRITGKRVGLHPVLLIAALFVFGHFFGLIGLLVAVPVTAVLMMYFRRWTASFSIGQGVPHPQGNDAT